MAPLIYLDTHVAVWLYGGTADLFPPAVRGLLEAEDLVVSPMVVLELQYLYEIRRTAEPAQVVLAALSRDLDLGVCDLPFIEVARAALAQTWTRDPFDRIIVGHAALRGARLLTKDRHIRANYSQALWSEEA